MFGAAPRGPIVARVKAFLALAALSLTLVTSGCNTGGQPASAPPSAPESTEAVADGGLGLILLTESDLPEGYAEAALPVRGGLGALLGCPALDTTAEASVSFAGSTAASLIHESIHIVTQAEGQQMLADLAALPAQCANAKAAAMPAMGEQSAALRLTATPAQFGTQVDGYLMAVRDATTVVVVVFVHPGTADPATAEAVTRAAWTKTSAQ